MDMQPAITFIAEKEGEDAWLAPFLEAFMEADARTEFNFCKKGMKKKHCKMDIGRGNSVISAKRCPKRNKVK